MVLKRLWRRLLVPLCLIALGAAGPLAVLASHQFTDVTTSNTFHTDIDAIRDAGVTTGCAVGKYCPKEFVTREQMAAFMNRLGALQAGKPPVVNAKLLNGNPATSFLPSTGLTLVSQVGPWTTVGQPSVIVDNTWDTRVWAPEDAGLFLNLRQPPAFSGFRWSLSRIEVCYGSASTPVTVNELTIGHTDLGSPLAIDTRTTPTGIAVGDCDIMSLEPGTLLDGAYWVHMELDGGQDAEIYIGEVRSLWAFEERP
jgi:hypothetical protein